MNANVTGICIIGLSSKLITCMFFVHGEFVFNDNVQVTIHRNNKNLESDVSVKNEFGKGDNYSGPVMITLT